MGSILYKTHPMNACIAAGEIPMISSLSLRRVIVYFIPGLIEILLTYYSHIQMLS
jgi:hypothetical protein